MELVRRESLGQKSKFWGEAEKGASLKVGWAGRRGRGKRRARPASPSNSPSPPFGWREYVPTSTQQGKRAERDACKPSLGNHRHQGTLALHGLAWVRATTRQQASEARYLNFQVANGWKCLAPSCTQKDLSTFSANHAIPFDAISAIKAI